METLLFAAFQVVFFPVLVTVSAKGFRFLLEYSSKPKPLYPSLDIAVVEIALLVREGRLEVGDIDFHLVGFSEGQKGKIRSILYETQYLTILDVDFQRIEEQMLFCQSLAYSVSSMNSRLNNLE